MSIFIIFFPFTSYCAMAMKLSLSPELKHDFSRVSHTINLNKKHGNIIKIKKFEQCFIKRLSCLARYIQRKDIDKFRDKLPLDASDYSLLLFDTIYNNTFPEGMKLLLERGANANIRDYSGRPPLCLAVCSNHIHLVKILLNSEGIDPNFHINLNETPLHLAVKEDLSILKMLLQRKDIRVDEEIGFHSGQTPLWNAIQSNNFEALKLLLAGKANPNKAIHGKQRPLHYALANFKYDMINILLQYKADPNKLSQQDVSEEFTDAYWKKYKSFVNYKKEVGSTALHMAVKRGYSSENLDVLLRCGADPNKTNYFDTYPVIFLIILDENENNAGEYNLEKIKKLILAGANINHKARIVVNNSTQMMTPYEAAVYLDKIEIAQLLANSQEFFREKAYKKFGTSIFKGTMLREMGVSSQGIKNFSKFNKK